MAEDAWQQTAGADRHPAEHKAHRKGGGEPLGQQVHHRKQGSLENDGGNLPAGGWLLSLNRLQHPAPEYELLADRRDHGEHEHHQPPWGVGEQAAEPAGKRIGRR